MPTTGRSAALPVSVSGPGTAQVTVLEATAAFTGLKATATTALWVGGTLPIVWVGQSAALNV